MIITPYLFMQWQRDGGYSVTHGSGVAVEFRLVVKVNEEACTFSFGGWSACLFRSSGYVPSVRLVWRDFMWDVLHLEKHHHHTFDECACTFTQRKTTVVQYGSTMLRSGGHTATEPRSTRVQPDDVMPSQGHLRQAARDDSSRGGGGGGGGGGAADATRDATSSARTHGTATSVGLPLSGSAAVAVGIAVGIPRPHRKRRPAASIQALRSPPPYTCRKTKQPMPEPRPLNRDEMTVVGGCDDGAYGCNDESTCTRTGDHKMAVGDGRWNRLAPPPPSARSTWRGPPPQLRPLAAVPSCNLRFDPKPYTAATAQFQGQRLRAHRDGDIRSQAELTSIIPPRHHNLTTAWTAQNHQPPTTTVENDQQEEHAPAPLGVPLPAKNTVCSQPQATCRTSRTCPGRATRRGNGSTRVAPSPSALPPPPALPIPAAAIPATAAADSSPPILRAAGATAPAAFEATLVAAAAAAPPPLQPPSFLCSCSVRGSYAAIFTHSPHMGTEHFDSDRSINAPAVLPEAAATATWSWVPWAASGQWIRGTGNNIAINISSDNMYRFRVAVTPRRNLIYAISGPNDTIVAFNFTRNTRGFQSAIWSTPQISGLAEKQPVLNVDTSTDQVYFLHPVDGRIYCYDASQQGPNAAAPVWVSSFVCSDPADTRNQHLQAFTANGTWLLARCNSSVVMVGPRGQLLKTFAGSSMRAYVASSDLAAAISVYNNFTRYQSAFDLGPLLPGVREGEMDLSVLPTPVIANKFMYGIVQGFKPSSVPGLYPDDYCWWFFAVNCTVPKTPTLLWVSQRQGTRGFLAPQVPWVTAPAVFITDYQQNATRGFDRTTGQAFFNVPTDPYTLKGATPPKGTYKISLPWVSYDGYFQVFQNDEWQYDQGIEGAGSIGNILSLLGTPFKPPLPP
ncbi:hypothetical protein VOLCADRAFT_91973 [Volvox carteri f. nagariensis]|uniref:Uncharacterized protein n=1 Tax=Volvox carteri f. nagariensis TaxID=3068 RepID=D8TYF5_VOLCA|nr:uncharacterized protein VOLCADRAFT_91973 [Volvox carteri f. nagariensis]EFJ47547.1 hypothetical protein VOLCADRAFT_91973 [Volvox carteri f. nagariensis]|eukprot:XP_002951371.1 hypothetical protein VOLCADRAFT_91973 [Volvox carteri f. nagariensis]